MKAKFITIYTIGNVNVYLNTLLIECIAKNTDNKGTDIKTSSGAVHTTLLSIEEVLNKINLE